MDYNSEKAMNQKQQARRYAALIVGDLHAETTDR